jgi:hypothetical protein
MAVRKRGYDRNVMNGVKALTGRHDLMVAIDSCLDAAKVIAFGQCLPLKLSCLRKQQS